MGIFLAILIFVSFIILLIFISKNRNSLNSKVSTASSSSSNKTVEADWSTSIFGEDAFRRGEELYQRGMKSYQVSPASASQYFRDAFNSIHSLNNRYSNNPNFYINLLECAMGFNYNTAISNGYKFFELAEYGNFTTDQIATI